MNVRMHEKVKAKEAIDVSTCERDGEFYIIKDFVEDADYCDLSLTAWVWSIGKRKSDGVIHASLRGNLYHHPDYECVWLR